MDGQKVINCLEEAISYLFVHNFDVKNISEVLAELRREYGLRWDPGEDEGTEQTIYRGVHLVRYGGVITAYFAKDPDSPFFETGSESHAIKVLDEYHAHIKEITETRGIGSISKIFEMDGWMFEVDFSLGNPCVKRYKYLGATSL